MPTLTGPNGIMEVKERPIKGMQSSVVFNDVIPKYSFLGIRRSRWNLPGKGVNLEIIPLSEKKLKIGF